MEGPKVAQGDMTDRADRCAVVDPLGGAKQQGHRLALSAGLPSPQGIRRQVSVDRTGSSAHRKRPCSARWQANAGAHALTQVNGRCRRPSRRRSRRPSRRRSRRPSRKGKVRRRRMDDGRSQNADALLAWDRRRPKVHRCQKKNEPGWGATPVAKTGVRRSRERQCGGASPAAMHLPPCTLGWLAWHCCWH
ncbi:hypothetical protein VDGL01_00511 [Verticillium dahliae]